MTSVKPGLRAIGRASWGPIYLVSGSAGGVEFIVDDKDGDDDPFDDDDEGEDEEEDEEEERPRAKRTQAGRKRKDDDQDAGEEEEETPPSRDEVERMRAALRRNNSENKRHRLTAKKLAQIGADGDLDAWLVERGLDPSTGQPIGQASPTDQDGAEAGDQGQQPPADQQSSPVVMQRQIRQAEARGAARIEAHYKPLVAEFAARSALADAGWVGKNSEMVMRLIDLDLIDVEVHEGRPVVLGIDEQVREIREEFPDWFRAPQGPSRTNGSRRRASSDRGGAEEVDGGDRGRAPVRPKGWLQQASAALMGQQQ